MGWRPLELAWPTKAILKGRQHAAATYVASGDLKSGLVDAGKALTLSHHLLYRKLLSARI
jgi:hypothetical protein